MTQDSAQNDRSARLRVTGLGKSFHAPVLCDLDFALRAGEVHALVGANGAGKSTFARILSGLETADTGTMLLDGQPYQPVSKRAAEHQGVVLVLQELNVLPTLTVAENLMLNRLPRRMGWISRSALRRMASRALARVGLQSLDPDQSAGPLSIAQQQLVEIAAALDRDCRVLILDEPTAALTSRETETLFDHVRRLRGEGVSILYISHRMDEILRLADRVTALRDGRVVATRRAAETTGEELVAMVSPVGRARTSAPEVARESGQESALSPAPILLSVEGLAAGTAVRDVSFQVRAGEIVGLSGLVGAGRSETLRAIFGALPRSGGVVRVGQPLREVTIRQPRDAVRARLALVPEDRKRDGLLLPRSVRTNVTLATVARDAAPGWLVRWNAETRRVTQACQALDVRYRSPEQPVEQLSGGNQQKLVLARWLERDADVYLLDEPTRGVDVAAKEAIYELVRSLARRGKGVVVVSSELPELLALCDRLVVLSAGKSVADRAAAEWTEEQLTRAAFQEQRTCGGG